MEEPINNQDSGLNKKSIEEAQTISEVKVNESITDNSYIFNTTPYWKDKIRKTCESAMDCTPSLKHLVKMTDEELSIEFNKVKLDLVQQYLCAKKNADRLESLTKDNTVWDKLIFYTQYNEPYTNDKGLKTYKRVIDLTESPHRKEVAFLVFQNSGGLFGEKPKIIDPHSIMTLAKTFVGFFSIKEAVQWIANSDQGRENIASMARIKWEVAGEPSDRDAEFWIAAEKDYMKIMLSRDRHSYLYKDVKYISVDEELKKRVVEIPACPDIIRNSYFTGSVEVIYNQFKVTIREGFPKSEWLLKQEAEGKIINSSFGYVNCRSKST